MDTVHKRESVARDTCMIHTLWNNCMIESVMDGLNDGVILWLLTLIWDFFINHFILHFIAHMSSYISRFFHSLS